MPSQSGRIWLLTPPVSPTSLFFGRVGRDAYPFFWPFLLSLSSGMDSEVCNSCTGEVSAPNPKPEAVWVPVPELFWRRRREGWEKEQEGITATQGPGAAGTGVHLIPN